MGITCKPFGETKKFFQKHLSVEKAKGKFFKKSNEESSKETKKRR